MVRRLVHQQDVEVAEQHLGHADAHLPTARQPADVARDHLVAEAEAVQDLLGLRRELVAAERGVLLLHLAVAREDRLHLVLLVGVGHRRLELLVLVVEFADLAATDDHLVEHGATAHLALFLAEVADRHALWQRHVAVVGMILAGDEAEDRRLARAVGADEADLFAGIELHARVDEEDLVAVALVDLVERDHRRVWLRCALA